jgi:hypothetical protein
VASLERAAAASNTHELPRRSGPVALRQPAAC